MTSPDRRRFCRIAAGCVVGGLYGELTPLLPTNVPCVADEIDQPDGPDEIWDLHCHFSGVNGASVEDRAEQILSYADRMHIERLVFFMGWPWSQDPDPDEFRRQNDQVLRVLKRWPDRLFGFAYLNAKYPEEALQEVERCIQNGPMVGIKLWVARKCSDEAIDPIIRRCGELKAAIYQHTWLKVAGNLPGESTPMDLARLARRHPSVPVICGHTGGDWTRGIRAVRDTNNVSVVLEAASRPPFCGDGRAGIGSRPSYLRKRRWRAQLRNTACQSLWSRGVGC